MDENTTRAQQPVEVANNGVSKDARTWGMACHLMALAGFVLPIVGIVVGPLVVWMLKRDEDPFIDDQGKEAVNFQITMLIAFVVCFFLMFVVIGAFLMPLVGLADLIFTIIGAMKANEGVKYRYPFAIRFLK